MHVTFIIIMASGRARFLMMMSRLVTFARSYSYTNSHKRADDTLWWTVQFSDRDGTWMEGGSCV